MILALVHKTDMIEKLRAVFSCIRESGMKLSTKKCQFGLRKIQFLGNTITSRGLHTHITKSQKFLEKLQEAENNQTGKRIIEFFQFYKAFIPELSKKLPPFNKILKKEAKFEIEEEHKLMLHKLTNDLKNA